ncbi:MAG: tetratricopeptide repeat protein [Thermoanaerobaculia bacterium]
MNPVRRFRLLSGGGESNRLDRFLCDPDPILLSSLRREEEGHRSRRLTLGLTAFLLLSAAGGSLWISGLLTAPASSSGRTAWKAEKARLLVEEARTLREEDRYAEALANATEAARLVPNLADAWVEIADCHLHNYQSGLALKAYDKALRIDPKNSAALVSLGHLYLRRGELKKAEQVWLRGGIDLQLARLYLLQGRFGEAQARLEPLLHGSGQSANEDLLFRMAHAARFGSLDPGLRSLLEPEPTGRSSWADLGWRLSQENRYGEAAVAFGKAVAQVPDDVNALSGLGWSLLAQDRLPEAKASFQRALAYDDDHVLSLNGLAHCLKSEGRTEEAIAVWQAMSKTYPGVNVGTPGLAWTYYEMRDYRQAAVYLARLVKRYPYDSSLIDALNVAVDNIGAVPPAR